jgi:molybdopterin synthase sulfur carrier subunit
LSGREGIMKLLYFAWIRTRIGRAEETVSPPEGIGDVAGLIDWLIARGPNYAAALRDRDRIKVAVNQEYTGFDRRLGREDEVAFFPPVTGG